MSLPANQGYEGEQRNQQDYLRNMVLQAIEQVERGETKDFNQVCDRLEKKYART